jgi:hypothetical protein
MYEALGGDTRVAIGSPPQARSIRSRVMRGLGIAGGVLLLVEALGLLSTRAFESALRVDPAFTAGMWDYFTAGARALIPFILVWVVAAAAVAVLVALRPLVAHRSAFQRLSDTIGRAEPTTMAAAIVCVAVVGFAVLIWQFWPVYYALTALAVDPRPEALDLSVLGWRGRPLHRNHSQLAASLGFLLAYAVVRWFPRWESRAADPERVRGLRWAAVVVVTLVVAKETATRSLIWERREVVSYGKQEAFVIGTSADELLLYSPAPGERKYIRVPVDSPDLRRNVGARPLFLEPTGP